MSLDKLPVLLAAGAGLLLAIWLTPRRAILPAVLLVLGLATFFMVGVAGLSIINRYLLVPSLMIMIFAAVALGGWSMLRPGVVQWLGRGGDRWACSAAWSTRPRTEEPGLHREPDVPRRQPPGAVRLLDDPKVRAGLRCGPLSVPNHKLIPEARWILKAGEHGVMARSDDAEAQARAPRRRALHHRPHGVRRSSSCADPTDPHNVVRCAS